MATPFRRASELLRKATSAKTKRVLLVLADGNPRDLEESLAANEELKAAGVRVVFVAVGPLVAVDVATALASEGAENVFRVSAMEGLDVPFAGKLVDSLSRSCARAGCAGEVSMSVLDPAAPGVPTVGVRGNAGVRGEPRDGLRGHLLAQLRGGRQFGSVLAMHEEGEGLRGPPRCGAS